MRIIAFSVSTEKGKDGRLMNPQTKGSTRSFVMNGRAITTNDNPKNKAWANRVSWFAREQKVHDSPWAGPVDLSLVFRMRRPAKMPKGRELPIVRPDLDKMVRSVKDALTKVLYNDDCQIVQLLARKEYADQPGVYIQLTGGGSNEERQKGKAGREKSRGER